MAQSLSRPHSHGWAVLVLVVGLIVTWLAYTPGLGASLQFDDHANLGGLASVDDATSAFRFIASGVAGPLGRPLALASFAPQAYAWPHNPETFLRTNVLIHLLNGALVTWFLLLVGRARGQTERSATLTAAGAGAIWMLMPLLASSSLLVVQRMTTLSALFVLVGAIAYMYARRSIDYKPVTSLFGMTAALAVGGTLAALTKENGALLFIFLLATEMALLTRPESIRPGIWRTWFAVVFLAPLAALLLFVISAVPYPESVILMRDFNGFERIITQARILWDYLFLAFVPTIPNIGPFHDDHVIHRSLRNFGTLLAIASWISVLVAAVMLRRRAPLFTFAVAWYLLGHLLESTLLALELYFEHRNYLPLVGPVYALVAGLAHLDPKWHKAAAAGAAGYAAILAAVLFSTTSLWGSPALAAEMWYIYKPDSMRAAQHLARVHENDENPHAALRLLQRYLDDNPSSEGIRLQTLAISCQLKPGSDHAEELRLLEQNLRVAQYAHTVPAAFQQLHRLVISKQCANIEAMSVYRLGQILLDNPRYKLPIVQHNIHAVMAQIAMDENDFGLTMSHLDEALRKAHNVGTLTVAINTLNSAGLFDSSWELLTAARDKPRPSHPLRAIQWDNELDQIEDALIALEQAENSSP